MKRRYYFLLAVALSGCVAPTGPDQLTVSNKGPLADYWDQSLLHIIYFPNSGGVFSARYERSDFLNSTGQDTVADWYQSHASLLNELGNEIGINPTGIAVTLDGTPLRFHYGFDSSLDLNFPDSVTWSMMGDTYFPSFTHSVVSETMPDIISPLATDTLSDKTPFHLMFDAPGADSVSIKMLYFGTGIRKSDTTGTIQSDIPDTREALIPNTGDYLVPPYGEADSLFYRNVTENEILASVAWAKTDTIRIGSKKFGFVTEVVRTRDYILKP